VANITQSLSTVHCIIKQRRKHYFIPNFSLSGFTEYLQASYNFFVCNDICPKQSHDSNLWFELWSHSCISKNCAIHVCYRKWCVTALDGKAGALQEVYLSKIRPPLGVQVLYGWLDKFSIAGLYFGKLICWHLVLVDKVHGGLTLGL